MKKGGLVIKVQKGGPRSIVEVRRCGLLSRATFQEVLLIRIHIMKVQDEGELRNI